MAENVPRRISCRVSWWAVSGSSLKSSGRKKEYIYDFGLRMER